MVRTGSTGSDGPGRIAPAHLFLAACLALSSSAGAAAQPAAAAQRAAVAPTAQAPAPGVPDTLVIHKLLWSTMAALDHANQTGNYSVLRDLGAPSFQASNSAATLGSIFTAIRNQNIDLSYTLVATPVFQFPPALVQGGLLRVRGVFPLRPNAIGFDLLFQNVNGQWRLFGIAVVPLVAQTQQPAAARR
jgi:hypothetical protein